ncbi:MAG: hypothetical protein ACI9G1_000187 [Pirellulaceae bacterium]|jgi:hypothetical protein
MGGRTKDGPMWVFSKIAPHSLVWLLAISVSTQGFPIVSCGCSSSSVCGIDQSAQCCCSTELVRNDKCCCSSKKSQQHSCCSSSKRTQRLAAGCCKGGTTCTCGPMCSCGQVNLPVPTAPPTEEHQTEKVTADSITISLLDSTHQPQIAPTNRSAAKAIGILTAMDRCVSLCRFTL